jgi:hypothetical protein
MLVAQGKSGVSHGRGRVWRASVSSASWQGAACIGGASSGGEAHASFFEQRPPRWGCDVLRAGGEALLGRCSMQQAQRTASPAPPLADVWHLL